MSGALQLKTSGHLHASVVCFCNFCDGQKQGEQKGGKLLPPEVPRGTPRGKQTMQLFQSVVVARELHSVIDRLQAEYGNFNFTRMLELEMFDVSNVSP